MTPPWCTLTSTLVSTNGAGILGLRERLNFHAKLTLCFHISQILCPYTTNSHGPQNVLSILCNEKNTVVKKQTNPSGNKREIAKECLSTIYLQIYFHMCIMYICVCVCVCTYIYLYIFPTKIISLFSWISLCSEKNCIVDALAAFRVAPRSHPTVLSNSTCSIPLPLKIYSFL